MSPYLYILRNACLGLFLLLLLGCNPKKTDSSTTQEPDSSLEQSQNQPLSPSAENPIAATQPDPQTPNNAHHSSAIDTPSVEPASPPTESTPLVPAKAKQCDPVITKLSSHSKNQHVFYVNQFNPGEFKCWIELENYGHAFCNGAPCILYFVDKADIPAPPNPNDPLDNAFLKAHGIGRYEYNGKYWEIKGSRMWKRQEKGYTYYNTDNQLGG